MRLVQSQKQTSAFLPFGVTVAAGAIIIFAIVAFITDPAVYRVFLFIPPGVGGMSFSGFSIKSVLLILFTHSVFALLGYTITTALIPSLFRNTHFITHLVSSYFVGYIAIIPIIRVLSFGLNFSYIYYATIPVVLAVCAFYLTRDNIKSEIRTFGYFNSSTILPQTLLLIVFSIMLFLLLMIQVYQADFFWSGHQTYLKYFQQWEAREHFPVITQHYGEMIISFMVQSLNHSYKPLINWWVSLGMVKLSVWVFFYVLINHIISSKPSALIFSTYLLIGTSSILPSKYYLLFSGSNPIAYNAYAGKAISEALPLLLIGVIGAALIRNSDGERPNARLSGSLPLLVLLMLGVSATVITNMFWIFVLGMLGVVFHMRHKVARPFSSSENVMMISLIYFSVFVSLILYGIPFNLPEAINARIILVGVILSGAILFSIITITNLVLGSREASEPTQWSQLQLMAAGILSGLFGLLFFGNLIITNPLGETFIAGLSGIFGNIDITGMDINERNLKSLSFGDYRELGAWNEFNKSLGHFIANYGAILGAALIGACIFERNKKRIISTDRESYILFGILTMCTVALPIFLLLMDFNDSANRTWDKSVFLQIPVAMIFFTTLCLIFRVGRRWEKLTANIYMLTFVVTPLIATERIEQISENFLLFMRLFGASG